MTELAPPNAHAGVADLDAGTTGVTPPSNPDRRGAFLADVVVELGFADRKTIDNAVRTASQSTKTVERYLLENRVVDETQLSRAIAERNGLDHVDLDRFEVDMAAAEMIGRTAALRYCAVPIAFAPDGALIVAVEDPLDLLGASDIEVMTRCEVRRVIAAASGIRGLAERLPEQAPPKRATIAVESHLASRPEPEPEPEPGQDERQREEGEQPQRAEPAAAPPEEPVPEGELGDLSVELRALRETARKADALAVTVGRRIEELEGADERAQRLERELSAARERNAELERRLSGVDAAAAELRETTEKLEAMYRVLEGSGG